MWVTKLLISAVKIRIFCPKKSKFGPKMAFLFILGQALPARLVGGCGARAVSRKTPIYFILYFSSTCTLNGKYFVMLNNFCLHLPSILRREAISLLALLTLGALSVISQVAPFGSLVCLSEVHR